jgi:4-amino-4-deoxy-L-arabinose transferase-like glycosyltransferase
MESLLKLMESKRNKLLFSILFILLIAYLPLFHNLSKNVITIWDEALYANNAIDMANNGSIIVLKEDTTATLVNVKPTLVIWLQVISIKVFGANEFAVRFPSALAALLTCFIVFFFAKKNFGYKVAILSILIVLSCGGYIRNHVTRTGDLDSVLVLFITGYTLLFIDFVINNHKQVQRFCITFSILLVLAFLTKGIAGWMPLLGIFLAISFSGKLRSVFLKRTPFIYFLFVLNSCLGYYFLREYLAPGYFKVVWESEFLRFTNNIMPWHSQPFSFYFKNFYLSHFKYFVLLLPLVLIKTTTKKASLFNRLSICFILTYLLLISYPTVKLDWYDAPIYPVLAVLVALSFLMTLQKIQIAYNTIYYVLLLVSIAFILGLPYKETIKQLHTSNIQELEKNGYALKHLPKNSLQTDAVKVFMTVAHPVHLEQVKFYIKALAYNSKIKIGLTSDISNINMGNQVIAEKPNDRKVLLAHFNVQEQKFDDFYIFYINSRKDN